MVNGVWTTNGRAPNIASSHHCIQEKTRVQRDFEMMLSRRLHLFTHCSRHMHQKRSRQRRSQAHHSANICTRQKLVLSPSPFLLLRTACTGQLRKDGAARTRRLFVLGCAPRCDPAECTRLSQGSPLRRLVPCAQESSHCRVAPSVGWSDAKSSNPPVQHDLEHVEETHCDHREHAGAWRGQLSGWTDRRSLRTMSSICNVHPTTSTVDGVWRNGRTHHLFTCSSMVPSTTPGTRASSFCSPVQ